MSKTIQILGTGCAKCRKLTEQVEVAAQALGIDYTIEKVTDLQQIMKFGVMMTPALAVNGRVKVAGRVPDPDTLRNLLIDS
jgi:small redox-active disulfide protein 2